VKESKNATDFEFKEGRISFDDISFQYENKQPALPASAVKIDWNVEESEEADQAASQRNIIDGLALEIEPGTSNALVGESGNGKSTLLNLLLRIYDPSEGSVRLDGQDLRDLKFSSFRKYITVIPQNGQLFNESILFNLQYSNEEATLEEVYEVAKKCKIHEKIIQMENGYQTQVGELGNALSGGEK